MADYNPSRSARALVLAGPALAFLATVFCLLTGTGVRILRGLWFATALWSLFAALAHVCGGDSAMGTGPLSIAMNSPKVTASGSTERRRPAATPGAATWRTRSFTVTTRAPPFRRRPPSRRMQTCKQPPCLLPRRRALRPGEAEPGREGAAEGRPGGCPFLSNTHQGETT